MTFHSPLSNAEARTLFTKKEPPPVFGRVVHPAMLSGVITPRSFTLALRDRGSFVKTVGSGTLNDTDDGMDVCVSIKLNRGDVTAWCIIAVLFVIPTVAALWTGRWTLSAVGVLLNAFWVGVMITDVRRHPTDVEMMANELLKAFECSIRGESETTVGSGA